MNRLLFVLILALVLLVAGCELATPTAEPTAEPTATATAEPTATPEPLPTVPPIISPLFPDLEPLETQDNEVSQLEIIRAMVGEDSLGYNELEFLCANEYPEVDNFWSPNPITLTVTVNMSLEYEGGIIAIHTIPSLAEADPDQIGYIGQTEPCTGTYTAMVYSWDWISDTVAIPPGAVVSEYIRIASVMTGTAPIYQDTDGLPELVSAREFGGYLLDGDVQYITDSVPFRTFTWDIEPEHTIYLPLVVK